MIIPITHQGFFLNYGSFNEGNFSMYEEDGFPQGSFNAVGFSEHS